MLKLKTKNFSSNPFYAGHCLVLLILLFMTISCVPRNGSPTAPASSSPAQLNETGQNEKPADTYTIINLGPAFQKFWEEAKDKPFAEQLKIWDRVVEEPYRDFYAFMSWEKDTTPDWQDYRKKKLQSTFKTLAESPELYPAIMQEFGQFEERVKTNIARFHKEFADAHFSHTIYAAITARYDGRVEIDKQGKIIQGFGIEVITKEKRDTNVLYAHELFHVYHYQTIEQANRAENFLGQPNPILTDLWCEGFASYISQYMNPGTSLTTALISDDLAKVKPEDIRWFAQEMLKNVQRPMANEDIIKTHRLWFNLGEDNQIRSGIPSRSGYLLGYHVVKLLNQKYSLDEMAHWSTPRFSQEVTAVLQEIAQVAK